MHIDIVMNSDTVNSDVPDIVNFNIRSELQCGEVQNANING